MFDKIKQLSQLRQKYQEIEDELSREVLEVSFKGVKVAVSANMQIVSLESGGKRDEEVIAAINRALKEAQKLASQRTRGQLSNLGFNIPGL